MGQDCKIYGGNIVRPLQLKRSGRVEFASDAYHYFAYISQPAEQIQFDHLASYTIYILDKPASSVLEVVSPYYILEKGDAVQIERCSPILRIWGGRVYLLVAGIVRAAEDKPRIVVRRSKDLYIVTKPWGQETWINQQHPGYILKRISIKSGERTSLQYHCFKRETNILLCGQARLHYKSSINVANDRVGVDDIVSVHLEPIYAIDVFPSTLHRLEAVTDVLLYEASTPHLDDVIRVRDDTNRPEGRIESEHTGKYSNDQDRQ